MKPPGSIIRTRPYPPPVDSTNPDLEWALEAREEWLEEGKPELDGPPLEQMKVAIGVICAHQRAIQ